MTLHKRGRQLIEAPQGTGRVLKEGKEEKPPLEAAKEIIQFLINNGIITK